jgi:hypothetical protein
LVLPSPGNSSYGFARHRGLSRRTLRMSMARRRAHTIASGFFSDCGQMHVIQSPRIPSARSRFSKS